SVVVQPLTSPEATGRGRKIRSIHARCCSREHENVVRRSVAPQPAPSAKRSTRTTRTTRRTRALIGRGSVVDGQLLCLLLDLLVGKAWLWAICACLGAWRAVSALALGVHGALVAILATAGGVVPAKKKNVRQNAFAVRTAAAVALDAVCARTIQRAVGGAGCCAGRPAGSCVACVRRALVVGRTGCAQRSLALLLRGVAGAILGARRRAGAAVRGGCGIAGLAQREGADPVVVAFATCAVRCVFATLASQEEAPVLLGCASELVGASGDLVATGLSETGSIAEEQDRRHDDAREQDDGADDEGDQPRGCRPLFGRRLALWFLDLACHRLRDIVVVVLSALLCDDELDLRWPLRSLCVRPHLDGHIKGLAACQRNFRRTRLDPIDLLSFCSRFAKDPRLQHDVLDLVRRRKARHREGERCLSSLLHLRAGGGGHCDCEVSHGCTFRVSDAGTGGTKASSQRTCAGRSLSMIRRSIAECGRVLSGAWINAKKGFTFPLSSRTSSSTRKPSTPVATSRNVTRAFLVPRSW